MLVILALIFRFVANLDDCPAWLSLNPWAIPEKGGQGTPMTELKAMSHGKAPGSGVAEQALPAVSRLVCQLTALQKYLVTESWIGSEMSMIYTQGSGNLVSCILQPFD